MKSLLLSLVFLGPLFSFSQVQPQDPFLKAVVFMIVDSTHMRIKAAEKNDFQKVCNALGTNNKLDTMSYYLAFEIFDSPTYSKRFYTEVGPFAARNYESMYRDGLPRALHQACMKNDNKQIREIVQKLKGISILE